MESTSPEHPEPRPIDRTSLSDAQKKSFQETVDQAREEEIARRQSMPTKLLGWMLIATLGFDIAGGISGADVYFGGMFLAFAGFFILRGSQVALRFSTFLLLLLAISGWTRIALNFASFRPMEIGSDWVDFRQMKFWSLGICPNVYLTTAVFLASVAFDKRGISFWSPFVKKLSCSGAVLLLAGGADKAFELRSNSALAKSFPEEIDSAREMMTSSLLGLRTISTRDQEKPFESMTFVNKFGWITSPNSSYTIYSNEFNIGKSRSAHRIRSYTEWLRLPSGEWAKLELEFILPENP